jgi:tRNA G18 (ribose-2'-O)-methylase SpoU
MQQIVIQHFDDPRLAAYRDLPRRSAARERGRFVVEGRFLVERLLASRCQTESILVAEPHADEIAELARDSETKLYVAPQSQLEQTVGFRFHRGVLACGKRPAPPALEEALGEGPAAPNRTRPVTVVVCANLDDPENLGGVLRNCAAFGVDAVVTGRRSADPFSRRALRVSMGASLKLPIVEPDDLATTLRELRQQWHVEPVATVLDASAEKLPDFIPAPRTVLVFGNEGHGLPADLLAQCDRRVTLPMRLGTDSLNVAVASGIFLYHVTR